MARRKRKFDKGMKYAESIVSSLYLFFFSTFVHLKTWILEQIRAKIPCDNCILPVLYIKVIFFAHVILLNCMHGVHIFPDFHFVGSLHPIS